MGDLFALLFDAGACEGALSVHIGGDATWSRDLYLATGLEVPRALFFVYFSLFVVVTGLGVVGGYHRALTHRAVRFSPWLEKALVLAGLYAGTPVQWVGNHRHHHAVADTDDDVHSPTCHGFWTAHAGWYLETKRTLPAVIYAFAGPFRAVFDAFWRPRTNQQWAHLAPDVSRVPFYAWLSRPGPYAAVLLMSAGFQIVLVTVLWGAGFTVVFLLAAFAFYPMGEFINSVGHRVRELPLIGPRSRGGFALGTAPYESGDESRNSHLLALFSFGDGFHNAHHAFPFSARAGLRPGEVDVTWWFIRTCEALGLARDVRTPSPEQIRAKMRATTAANDTASVGVETGPS